MPSFIDDKGDIYEVDDAHAKEAEEYGWKLATAEQIKSYDDNKPSFVNDYIKPVGVGITNTMSAVGDAIGAGLDAVGLGYADVTGVDEIALQQSKEEYAAKQKALSDASKEESPFLTGLGEAIPYMAAGGLVGGAARAAVGTGRAALIAGMAADNAVAGAGQEFTDSHLSGDSFSLKRAAGNILLNFAGDGILRGVGKAGSTAIHKGKEIISGSGSIFKPEPGPVKKAIDRAVGKSKPDTVSLPRLGEGSWGPIRDQTQQAIKGMSKDDAVAISARSGELLDLASQSSGDAMSKLFRRLYGLQKRDPSAKQVVKYLLKSRIVSADFLPNPTKLKKLMQEGSDVRYEGFLSLANSVQDLGRAERIALDSLSRDWGVAGLIKGAKGISKATEAGRKARDEAIDTGLALSAGAASGGLGLLLKGRAHYVLQAARQLRPGKISDGPAAGMLHDALGRYAAGIDALKDRRVASRLSYSMQNELAAKGGNIDAPGFAETPRVNDGIAPTKIVQTLTSAREDESATEPVDLSPATANAESVYEWDPFAYAYQHAEGQMARDLAYLDRAARDRRKKLAEEAVSGSVRRRNKTSMTIEESRELLKDGNSLLDQAEEAFSELELTHPSISAEMMRKSLEVADYIQQRSPAQRNKTLSRPEGSPPSATDRHQFEGVYRGAAQPRDTEEDIASGSATLGQVKAYRDMWPEQFLDLKAEVIAAIQSGKLRPTRERAKYLSQVFGFQQELGSTYGWEFAGQMTRAQNALAQEKKTAPNRTTMTGDSARYETKRAERLNR